MKKLSVIIPVYNEDEVIADVLVEWLDELRRLNIDFQICVYNDGSTDKTKEKIKALAHAHEELSIHDKKNSGHGPTILEGYQNCHAEWIFQTDSDNEIKPDQFEELWTKRENNDFIIGIRTNRESPISRKLVSLVSRWTVKLLYGNGVEDVNCPYRLYRREAFIESFKKLPNDTFAPNVILSGIACRHKMRIDEIPVVYRFRSTGEVSIKKWKLLKSASRSWWQTVRFALTN